MAGKLIESHVEYTKGLIKTEFIHLFEKQGLEKTSVNQICNVCSISRSTFYQYYDDKYDLLESIEDELLETVRSINSDMHKYAISDTDTSIPLWIETASYIYDKRDFFRPLILIPGDPRFVHKWNKVIRNTIQLRLAADNLDCSSMDMELVTYSMASSMIGMYEYWFQYRPDLTPKQIAESGSKLLWSAFYKLQDPS